jgi:hypothetical protein
MKILGSQSYRELRANSFTREASYIKRSVTNRQIISKIHLNANAFLTTGRPSPGATTFSAAEDVRSGMYSI